MIGNFTLRSCGISSSSSLGPIETIPSSLNSERYSRQIFVYGESAQRNLMNSHISIIINENDSFLGPEVVKNLALSGIGKLSVYESPNAKRTPRRLMGDCKNLVEYASSLNPHIKVSDNISI